MTAEEQHRLVSRGLLIEKRMALLAKRYDDPNEALGGPHGPELRTLAAEWQALQRRLFGLADPARDLLPRSRRV